MRPPVDSLDPSAWHSHALLNRVQSFLLLAVMGGLVALLGEMLWGAWLVPMAVTLGALALFARSDNAPAMMLRLYGARVLRPEQAPELHAAVRELARRAGLPAAPALAYVPSPVVNAFATGCRDRAVVAVTDGLLRTLDMSELVAVLAHEVAHIRNNDLRVMMLADLMARLTHVFSHLGQLGIVLALPFVLTGTVRVDWFALLVLILAPTVAVLAQLGLSRTREFHADLNAARLTGRPAVLARALLELERGQPSWWERVLMPGRRVPQPSYLRTHPTTEERVARLRALTPERLTPVLSLAPVPAWPPSHLLGSAPTPPRWRVTGVWY